MNYKSTGKQKLFSRILFIGWIFIVFLKLRTDSNVAIATIWCILFVLGLLIPSNHRIGNLKKEQKIWLLYAVFMFFSTIFNIFIGRENNHSSSRLIFDLIFSCSFPVIVTIYYGARSSATLFWLTYRNTFAIFSLLGLFEYIFKIQFYKNLIISEGYMYNFFGYGSIETAWSYRTTLIFYHPIYYSVLLVIGIMSTVYFPIKNRALQFLTLSAMSVNIILTQARTGWVVTFCVLIFYFLNQRSSKISKKTIYNLAKGSFIVVIVAFLLYKSNLGQNIIETIFSRLNQTFSNSGAGSGSTPRIENLSMVKKIYRDSDDPFIVLFGGGNRFAASYLQNNPTSSGWIRAIDNQYLTILLDYGIIGLSTILFFLFSLIKCFFTQKNSTSGKMNYLALISILISALTFEPIGANIIYYLMAICLGLLSCKDGKETNGLSP